MKSKIVRICRTCHDQLEWLIRIWELSVERLYKHLEFYVWIVDAFLNVTNLEEIAPDEILAGPDIPWRDYEIGVAA